MDCSVIPLSRHHQQLALVQTVDFFYPLVDDPRIMGEIALANVLSDMYAVGVLEFDNLKMLISSPSELSQREQDTIVPLLIEGFANAARPAGLCPEIQNIVVNPWCIIGGVATSVCYRDDIIMPCNAKAGDLIILTKPLGTHLATNALLWMQDQNENYHKIRAEHTDEDINETFLTAINSMTYLNKNAATLMHKYKAHAATDITGFGLLGHAKNLADYQIDSVVFKIKKLPIMKNVLSFGRLVSQDAKLRAGRAVETSGGLLICLPAANAEHFCNEFTTLTFHKQSAWIVGEVISSDKRDAIIVDKPEFIEVTVDA